MLRFASAAEILDTNTKLDSEKSLRVLLGYVTNIGGQSVDAFLEEREKGSRVLKRVLRLYNRASALGTHAAKSVVNVPLELLTLLEKAESAPLNSQDGVIELISFFSEEARPEDVAEALVRWCTPDYCDSRLFPVFQSILKVGAQSNAGTEMSGSLYRIIQAHSIFEESVETLRSSGNPKPLGREQKEVRPESLWTQLSHGALYLEK